MKSFLITAAIASVAFGQSFNGVSMTDIQNAIGQLDPQTKEAIMAAAPLMQCQASTTSTIDDCTKTICPTTDSTCVCKNMSPIMDTCFKTYDQTKCTQAQFDDAKRSYSSMLKKECQDRNLPVDQPAKVSEASAATYSAALLALTALFAF